MSFVLYAGGRGYIRPDQRITGIGDEPVEYYEDDSIFGKLNPKWSHIITPSVIVKSIGGKPVEYDPSIFSIKMKRIGDEPVKYSFFGNSIAWIGDKEVKSSSWNHRISTIGGKPVQYSDFPKDPFEIWKLLITASVIVGLVAIVFFVQK